MPKIYTVQLKFGYRFVMDYNKSYEKPINLLGAPYLSVYKNKENAEKYIQTIIPRIIPPFFNIIVIEVNDWHINKDYHTNVQWSKPLEFLQNYLNILNLPEPDYWWDDENLIVWWEIIYSTHDADTIKHIRQKLELPDWGENPFKNGNVYTEPENITIDYYPPLSWLFDFAKDCGFPAPERTSEGIHAWWTEYFPQMTPEQQRALWNWFDPEPFIITEIELEGEL
jgi:hypothetical protein